MNKLMDKLIKIGSVTGASLMSDSKFFNAKAMVASPLPILNIAFSGDVNGGFTPGVHLFCGESKTFKSMLALYCLKAYLDKYEDAIGILYDTEYGITPDAIRAFGIDPSRIIHIPVEHIEELKFDFTKKLENISRGDHVFFLVDSIGQISSKKEFDDTHEEKSTVDMSRAKSLRSLMRLVTIQLVKKELPCIMINHVYVEIGGGPYSKTIIPGGCLEKGTLITMSDGKMKAIEDILEGDLVKTLEGAKQVEHVWNPETLLHGTPECLQIEFDDGFRVVCSESHPFLTTSGWVKAKDLTGNEDVVSIS